MKENRAINFFIDNGLEDRIFIAKQSTASASDAAKSLNVELKTIAKSLTFKTKEKPILVVMAGDAKIDSKKFKQVFKIKSKMLDEEEITRLTGYKIGGVCPFNLLSDEIEVFLDISLKRSEIIYPGCGDATSLVKLTIEELEIFTNYKGWIDIGKDYEK